MKFTDCELTDYSVGQIGLIIMNDALTFLKAVMGFIYNEFTYNLPQAQVKV